MNTPKVVSLRRLSVFSASTAFKEEDLPQLQELPKQGPPKDTIRDSCASDFACRFLIPPLFANFQPSAGSLCSSNSLHRNRHDTEVVPSFIHYPNDYIASVVLRFERFGKSNIRKAEFNKSKKSSADYADFTDFFRERFRQI